ncbi:MAG TPA: family 43 glycosylhydrolase, partial [Pedobacter sp.]|nr:family 43 glycosylhydrolase [Pedobacter sp.]
MKPQALLICLTLAGFSLFAQEKTAEKTSGNPLFPGWYADPEAAIFGKEYWIYPTYSAKYEEQIYMDAYSSKDLISWKKHPNILEKANVKWAHKAMWAPSIIKKG